MRAACCVHNKALLRQLNSKRVRDETASPVDRHRECRGPRAEITPITSRCWKGKISSSGLCLHRSGNRGDRPVIREAHNFISKVAGLESTVHSRAASTGTAAGRTDHLPRSIVPPRRHLIESELFGHERGAFSRQPQQRADKESAVLSWRQSQTAGPHGLSSQIQRRDRDNRRLR